MLAAFRNFAKSWFARILLGVLAISFVGWGVEHSGVTRLGNSDVVTAGSRHVGGDEFKQLFDRYKTSAEQQVGQPIALDVAVANGFDRQVLNAIATDESYAELIHRLDLRPSDRLVAGEIGKIPAFFDQVSGRFDRKTYEARLVENGYTVDRFERGMRDEIARRHLETGVLGGMQVPRAYAALAGIYSLESRDIAYFPIDPRSVGLPPLPTDAQLQGFMKENAARLMRPEFRILTVVRFAPSAAAGGLAIDEAELKKRYDFRKDTLSSPETRTLVQIPARDAATAQKIVAGLAAGQAPEAVAKGVGVDAITYTDKPQAAIADRRAAAAAFSMPAGQAAPVQGDLGVSVVKVLAVKPGRQVTLAEARPALEAELRKDMATEKVYAQSQAYDDAHQKGATLAEAAQKAGVPAMTIGPVSKQGQGPDGQPVAGLSEKLMQTAFGLPAGGESDLVDAGGGEYFAVRVEKVVAPAMPALAEVKPMLTRVWMQREMMKRLEARAGELTARLNRGEAFDAVAASAGSRVTRIAGVDRQTAGQKMQAEEFLGKALSAKAGESFIAPPPAPAFGLLVGKVEAVRSGQGPTLARIAESVRSQMTMAIAREAGMSVRDYARRKVKVRASYARAREALGLEPADKPGKPEKAK